MPGNLTIQIDGKQTSVINIPGVVPIGMPADQLQALLLSRDEVKSLVNENLIERVIYIPTLLVNIITKDYEDDQVHGEGTERVPPSIEAATESLPEEETDSSGLDDGETDQVSDNGA